MAGLGFDLSEVIKAAKLGAERKDAQVDACSVFAAALYDVLKARHIPCRMFTAAPIGFGRSGWYHSVVKVGSTYYDSMGVFSEAIYRARARIHPKVTFLIGYRKDSRADCYESEFEKMHEFFVKQLSKAMEDASLEAARSREALQPIEMSSCIGALADSTPPTLR